MFEVVSTLANVVIPAFLVIAAGWLFAFSFKPDINSLNRVGLYAAVPALVFGSMARTELSFSSLWRLVLGQLLFLLLMFFLARLLSAGFDASSRRGMVATSMYGNSANLMLPVTLFAFGEAGLERALVLFVLSSLALFATGPLVLAGKPGAGEGARLRKILRLPVIWAAVLGVMANVFNWSFPTGLMRGIDILGQAAIPVVLLVLGMQMQQSGWRAPGRVNYLASSTKLILAPLLSYGIARLIGATGLDLAVLVLLAAMPPAVNNFMLALEFKANAEEVARTVVLATLVSLVTVSVVVTILQRFVLL